jgi:hypothetical protein
LDVIFGFYCKISRKNFFILHQHEVFQGYYYLQHMNLDRNRRDEFFKNHEFYEPCAKFCELYDAPSFDPNYESLPIEGEYFFSSFLFFTTMMILKFQTKKIPQICILELK